ncbi:MAG: hypothetical protein K0Q87_5127, partial [Neobacillus sp.]|nr:hypothetical protein [Neobacillus sp.]
MPKPISIPFLDELEWLTPMGNLDDSITFLLKEWEKVRIDLELLYKKRDQKTTISGMKKGIGLFLQFLFWSNDKQIAVLANTSLSL